MNAKLARIEKAEAEYMLNHKSKEEAAAALADDKVCARLVDEGDNEIGGKDTEVTGDLTEVKRKKKKRKRDKYSDEGNIEPDRKTSKGDDSRVVASVTLEPILEPKRKKKKDKKKVEENTENEEPQEEAGVIKTKKSKKSKKSHESSTNETQTILVSEEISLKKKKKSKGKKLKGGSD